MPNGFKKIIDYIIGYAGPLEPKKSRKNVLDWLCSGISFLIIIGSLVGIILWQVKEQQEPKQVRIIEPAPSNSFNPANPK